MLLSIWEPAPMTSSRAKPFLFMVRLKLPSEAEARELLDHYFQVYQAVVIPTTDELEQLGVGE